MKLGVTSDLHGSLGKARKFASYFKKSDVDAIVLAGDTPSEEKQGQSLTKILKIFVKTGKKVFILPGSHEQYVPYYAALKKSSKVTDCTKTFVAKIDYQKIVFIPGADSTASGAGFKILRDRKQYKRFRKRVRELKAHFWGKIIPFYLNDFTKFLDKNTIIVSHNPPKFRTKKAIDFAIFGTPKKPFFLREKHKTKFGKKTTTDLMLPNQAIISLAKAKQLIKSGYPVKIDTENAGNTWLKAVIRKNKVRFFVGGHIHESGGKANDLKEKPVQPGKWSKELFYNCSGRAGIVEFLNGKARYKSIK